MSGRIVYKLLVPRHERAFVEALIQRRFIAAGPAFVGDLLGWSEAGVARSLLIWWLG